MKKLLSICLIFCLSFQVFANNYEKYLSKAIEYESKKQYVYALGYYYDAIQEDSIKTEAKEKFDLLSNKMRKGSDGLNLGLWDDPKEHWKKVIMEFHQYFTEFSPYEFYYFKELKRGELDYKNKTATYLMEYDYSLTEKFMLISEILTECEKFDESDKECNWYYADKKFISSTNFNDSRQYWNNNFIPYMSFSFDSIKNEDYKKRIEAIGEDCQKELHRYGLDSYQTTEDFFKYLAIVYKYNDQKNKVLQELKAKIHTEIIKFYSQKGIALSVSSENDNNKLVLAAFSSFNNDYNFKMPGKYLPYDIKFGVFDNNDKLLLEGTRQSVYSTKDTDTKSTYYFTKATESIMNTIEGAEYSIKPIAVYLNYGAFRSSEYEEDTPEQVIRELYLKNAEEIKQDLEKCHVIDFSFKLLQEQERIARLQEEEKKKKEEEKRIKEEEKQKTENEKKNYTANYNILYTVIKKYLNNCELIGLYFEETQNNVYTVTKVLKGSEAYKAGIKAGNTITFMTKMRFEDFNNEYIINTFNLENSMKEKLLSDSELEQYIMFALNEKYIINTKEGYSIGPMAPGAVISIIVDNGKKKKTVVLTMPK